MTVLVELVVPATEFVLAETLTAVPSIRIEIKRVVAGTESVTPYFWAFGEEIAAFERALRDDPSVHELVTLEEQQEQERFYRVTWNKSVPNLLTAASNAKATILEAVNSEGGEWELKMLFPDRDALTEFHDYCVDHDFYFQIERVYQPENPQERAEYGVTDKQEEALVTAYREGYFDVPRDSTLDELADQVGISRNAMSNRLRRGQRNLLSQTLIHEEGSSS